MVAEEPAGIASDVAEQNVVVDFVLPEEVREVQNSLVEELLRALLALLLEVVNTDLL